jgi:hypothetical protein
MKTYINTRCLLSFVLVYSFSYDFDKHIYPSYSQQLHELKIKKKSLIEYFYTWFFFFFFCMRYWSSQLILLSDSTRFLVGLCASNKLIGYVTKLISRGKRGERKFWHVIRSKRCWNTIKTNLKNEYCYKYESNSLCCNIWQFWSDLPQLNHITHFMPFIYIYKSHLFSIYPFIIKKETVTLTDIL